MLCYLVTVISIIQDDKYVSQAGNDAAGKRNKPKAVLSDQDVFQSTSSMLPSVFLVKHSTQGESKGEVRRVNPTKAYGELEF